VDFYRIKTKESKGVAQVYPDWVVDYFDDLMVRGGDFYAVWDDSRGLWSQNEFDVQNFVDRDLKEYADQHKDLGLPVEPLLCRNFSTGTWEKFNRYIRNLPTKGNYHSLDDNITFTNQVVTKKDYVSKRLPYALEMGRTDAWDELLEVLYSPTERDKIEWAIGAIIAGDSKWIQKFLVFYGPPASGKSTIISVIEKLFEGYVTAFEAKALTSNSFAFAMEAFESNPLVAIQHDGDLSRIEDNTRLNSIVGHDFMTINVKYRSAFTIRPNAFLIMGTNKPVKITDAKAGNTRRLIDVHPTGAKIEASRYHILMENVNYELGAIAHHCYMKYLEMGKFYYENYIPTKMMMLTDTFYNFIEAHYDIFKAENGIQLKRAWELYKQYCEDAHILKHLQYHEVREELNSYFDEFIDRHWTGEREIRSVYLGFKGLPEQGPVPFVPDTTYVIDLDEYTSVFDRLYSGQPAQKANRVGRPQKKWKDVTTTLKDIDTTELHYVKVPKSHIVIDYDLMDEAGERDLPRNIEEASKMPPTYTELSQSGKGIHLHYIYNGDVNNLASELQPGVEIKTLLGDSSLRRRLTKCNNLDIMTISGGLPKKEKKMIEAKSIQTEKGLRELLGRNLRKEIHPGTKPSIDFIHHILEEAYNSGLSYDVTDMRPDILTFAAKSTHQPANCIKMVQSMKFVGKDNMPEPAENDKKPIIFFDCEVYPNLFVICWKVQGKPGVVRMRNPKPEDVEMLFKQKLVGFNNRRYDNHILYARYLGYDNEALFKLSDQIINEGTGYFGEAYNLSYTDVLDFSSDKRGLKKWQIALGIFHKELDLPWDQPVDPKKWELVEDYCVNDVESTEAVFQYRIQDFVARQILSDLSGLSVNHTTREHTTRIIFGDDKRPQTKFVYTDLSEDFPGYQFDGRTSTYDGEVTGEGGYVYSEPGYYTNVAVLDVVSMHPTSIVELNLFGPYTAKFAALKEARVAVKRKSYSEAEKILGGKISKYLADSDGTAEDLSYALKIIINSVYGFTSASFDNAFKDNRNKDNIVAKRGALFMINLRKAVEEQGFPVVHIKTDSVKIPDASDYIIEFIKEYGKRYGYDFELEDTYERFCLVNDAVYVARSGGVWTAVGAQFQHPYVYKTLLSHEPPTFDDYCETKSVQKGRMYLDTLGTQRLEDMRHVGQTGSFVPVAERGGTLYRVKDDKLYTVTGTKGHLWIERELAAFRESEGELVIDMTYFEKLRDDAIKTIEQFVPYSDLVS